MKDQPKIDRPGGKSRFNIAGALLRVSCATDVCLKPGNSLYRRFSAGAGAGEYGRQALDIRLHCGSLPAMDGMDKMFDTGDSWSMFRNKGRRCIVFSSPAFADPFWMACFDRCLKRVDYYFRPAPPVPGRNKIGFPSPLRHPFDQLLLMYYFARRQGMLAHAAGLIYKGKAYVFAGVSGAGKSTFSELLVKTKTGKVLSDERMIVRRIGRETIAFGTPWAGTAGIARSGSAPLAGIFFLKHGKTNRIEKLDPRAAADRLLPMISIPWYDLEAATPIIAFARRLTSRVPAYEFRFTPDCSAVDFFRSFLQNPPPG